MDVLIVSGGNRVSNELLKQLCEKNNLIICADRGAEHLVEIGILPDVMIGDFDSISKSNFEKYKAEGVEVFEHPSKKDSSDTELCINYAIEKKATKITITNAFGGRMDHEFANISLLYNLLNSNIEGHIIDDRNDMFVLKGKKTIEVEDGRYISIMPLFKEGALVKTNGFEYEVEDVRFEYSSSFGISNKLLKEKGTINIKEGVCLIVISKD